MEGCPFCHQDPFEYVDVGVGYVPVAVTCCELGVAFYSQSCSPKLRRAADLISSEDKRRVRHGKSLLKQIYNQGNQ